MRKRFGRRFFMTKIQWNFQITRGYLYQLCLLIHPGIASGWYNQKNWTELTGVTSPPLELLGPSPPIGSTPRSNFRGERAMPCMQPLAWGGPSLGDFPLEVELTWINMNWHWRIWINWVKHVDINQHSKIIWILTLVDMDQIWECMSI